MRQYSRSMSRFKWISFFSAVFFLIWSAVNPLDRNTWILETIPSWVGLPLLFYCERRRRVTPLLFGLICLHSIVLSIGGAYTYAQVPLGAWVSELMGWSRNHYDRFGHLMQGLAPVILAREVLIRKKVVTEGFWLFIFCVSLCLSFSAFYELIEWWAAIISGDGAEAFLGTQGDVWDTQWDMFMALMGAFWGAVFLSRWHNNQIRQIW